MMITKLFNMVLSTSISSIVVILSVLLIRYLFRDKLSKSFSYLLWLIVLVKLIVPINFESSLSINNYIPIENFVEFNYENQLNDTFEEVVNSNNVLVTEQSESISNETTFDINKKESYSLIQMISVIWLTVSLCLIMYFLIAYLSIKRKLSDAVLHKNYEVYVTDKIKTPLLLGLMSPKILIPKAVDLNDTQMKYIMDHELIHMKRYDHIIKPLALLVTCIYWFNPLVWASYFIAMKDMELSCDEKVIMSYEDKYHSSYAETLLKISMTNNQISLGGLVSFGEKSIKTRIQSVLNFKKLPRYISILSLMIICFLSVVLISKGNEESQILSVLNDHYAYSVSKDDIIEIFKMKDDVYIYHDGYSKNQEYEVYVLTALEKKGFGWKFKQSSYSQLDKNKLDLNNSGYSIIHEIDKEYRLISGVIKIENLDHVNIYNQFEEETDVLTKLVHIEEDVYFFYKSVDVNKSDYYSIEFLDKDNNLLHTMERQVKTDPIEAVEAIRNYKIITENIIDIVESEIGTLVFYFRTINDDQRVYCFDLLEKNDYGYRWVTGGQHSGGRLDADLDYISSLQSMKLTEKGDKGFIFGVAKKDIINIEITTTKSNTEIISDPQLIKFDDDLTLWYSILPNYLGDVYDVQFETK